MNFQTCPDHTKNCVVLWLKRFTKANAYITFGCTVRVMGFGTCLKMPNSQEDTFRANASEPLGL